jgi:cyclopropane-fatty-acyl-phospholipid synthase
MQTEPLLLDRGSPTQTVGAARPLPAPGIARPLAWLDRWCLAALAAGVPGAPIRVRLWNGTMVQMSETPPVATVVVHDRATLLRLVLRRELAFGEGYTDGHIEIEGDLTRLLEAANRAHGTTTDQRTWHPFGSRARVGTPAAARRNIRRHYDLAHLFYRLWLDDAMVYTCAYFEESDLSLENAQRAKLDYVCRKLRLRPGDRVIEAGCGWGALALHMARHYEVTVRAYNISDAQLRYARSRAEREGLTDRVTFVDGDYRSIDGGCDAFVSIGMVEHVGQAGYRALGDVIHRVLNPVTGRGLLHFIGRNRPRPFDAWIRRYIFPGSYAPVLSEVFQDVFEPNNLSVLDVENLRMHYATTLRHWLARFDRAAPRVAELFDEPFVRMWRLYLSSAQAAFTTGDLQLFQVTFGRSADNTSPQTRAPLYTRAGHGSL